MARKFSPGEIRRVQVELTDGTFQDLSQAEVYEYMRTSDGGGSGGINVQQFAEGATALSGMLSVYQNERYRDDEAYARSKLAKANQKLLTELRKLPNGQALGDAFIEQCAAQEKLDRAQDLINRSEDMAILINSGGAAAKALLSNQNGVGSGVSTEQFLLGGVGIWAGSRLLSDGRSRRRDYDRDEDLEDLGVSTVPK